MSLKSQQNENWQLINTNINHENNQQNEINEQNFAENYIIQSSDQYNLSAGKIWMVMLVLVVLFLLFIIWVVSILTSISLNSNQKLRIGQYESFNTSNTTSVIIQENYDEIKEFISKFNLQNQPTDLFFAKYLLKNSQNQFYSTDYPKQKHQRQLKYYESLYGNYWKWKKQQISMCIVATGRNNMAHSRQKRFLDSVQRLNYGRLTLVYVDDNSQDQTAKFTQEYIKNSTKLQNKGIVVRRQKRFYALANKIIAIQNYCQVNDIIIDVDADDSFIGKQVLGIINYLYQKNTNIWFLYTNHIIYQNGKFQLSKNKQLTQNQIKEYRISSDWVTSHLKTYKRELFMRIDKNQWKLDDGSYFHWASDRYIMYSLVQLAGSAHTKFQNIILYLYDYGAAGDVRNFQIIKPDKIKSQLLIPYQQLSNIKDELKKVQNYVVPALLSEYYRRAQQKYEHLVQKNKLNQ